MGYVESGVVGIYEYAAGNGLRGVTGDGRLHGSGGTRTTESPLLLRHMRAALFLGCRLAPDREALAFCLLRCCCVAVPCPLTPGEQTGQRPSPLRMLTLCMKEKHVLWCEALLGWCKNTLGPASVPHEVMAAVVGGIVRYAAPYLSNTAETVVKLNAAIKAAALQFEKLPKDLSNVAVRSGHGLRLADVQVICRDSVVATLAQLTHHRSTTVRDELRAMLRDIHQQYGVCGQFMVPSASFATHAGNTWVDRVLWAMGTLRVGLLVPSSVYSCVHAQPPQVQWAGRKWVSQSYTFKGRDICVLSGPRTDAAVQSLTDPANDLLHARLPCPAPGHWAVQLQDCHEDHLHLPHARVGPN